MLREQLRTRPGFGGLIGISPKMQRVYRLIEKVSQHNYPVLILGESGTGKELVARSIHYSGARRNRPFVPVDCSALVPTLIESELFGYVKGAFTGAMHSKQGLMESAGNGTLFLDEIGDLPIDLQAKLLRALQEKEIKPVGSTDRVAIGMRVIAATNRDLEDAVRQGEFRQDLFFRLNVVQIKLPPLRERKGDIPAARQFVPRKIQRASADTTCTMSEDAMARLMAYDWPGNMRELENCHRARRGAGLGPDAAYRRLAHQSPVRHERAHGARTTSFCPSKSSSAAPFSARSKKPAETSLPPRDFSASARPRSTASSSSTTPRVQPTDSSVKAHAPKPPADS